MALTVVVTIDVAARFRGFLSSIMLELVPGVYTSPRMTKAVRDRVWLVLERWYDEFGGGAILMTWRDRSSPGGQAIRLLGVVPKELVEYNDVILARRVPTQTQEPQVQE